MTAITCSALAHSYIRKFFPASLRHTARADTGTFHRKAALQDAPIQSGSPHYPQGILLLNNIYRILGLSLSDSGFQPPKTIPELSHAYAHRHVISPKRLACKFDMQRKGLPSPCTGLS